MQRNSAVVYLGFNNPFIHKRGVENVILIQAKNQVFTNKYYIFFGIKNETFDWEGIKCISIKNNIFRFIKLNWELFQLKRKHQLFIHSHNYLMSFFSIFRTSLFTVHDGLFYQYKSMEHKHLNLFKFIEKSVYKRATHAHFISNFTKNNSLYPTHYNNFTIIGNSTPYEFIKAGTNIQKEEGKILIFGVRSIEERALVNLWIEVAERSQDKSYTFKLAGKGLFLEHYRNVIKEKGLTNITLLGYTSDEDVAQLYSLSDLVMVTAQYGEGFGLPIIESYLYNKPVIASNICAIPEVIISNDYLFQNTADDILAKIEFALNHNRTNFHDFYLKKYSSAQIINQYEQLYRQILQ